MSLKIETEKIKFKDLLTGEPIYIQLSWELKNPQKEGCDCWDFLVSDSRGMRKYSNSPLIIRNGRDLEDKVFVWERSPESESALYLVISDGDQDCVFELDCCVKDFHEELQKIRENRKCIIADFLRIRSV